MVFFIPDGYNAFVVKGIVPDSFKDACPDKIAFLHIDMNSSKSEIAALEHLWEKVVPGGIVIFDDFGWLGYNKQTAAEIDWLAKRDHHVLELPTGQGMVVKKSKRTSCGTNDHRRVYSDFLSKLSI